MQDCDRRGSGAVLCHLRAGLLLLHPPLPQERPEGAHRLGRDDLPAPHALLPHQLFLQQRAPALPGLHGEPGVRGHLQNPSKPDAALHALF